MGWLLGEERNFCLIYQVWYCITSVCVQTSEVYLPRPHNIHTLALNQTPPHPCVRTLWVHRRVKEWESLTGLEGVGDFWTFSIISRIHLEILVYLAV